MDNEVKPTWRLAWGLWWRMFIIGLGASIVIGWILYLVGISLIGSLLTWAVPWWRISVTVVLNLRVV